MLLICLVVYRQLKEVDNISHMEILSYFSVNILIIYIVTVFPGEKSQAFPRKYSCIQDQMFEIKFTVW